MPGAFHYSWKTGRSLNLGCLPRGFRPNCCYKDHWNPTFQGHCRCKIQDMSDDIELDWARTSNWFAVQLDETGVSNASFLYIFATYVNFFVAKSCLKIQLQVKYSGVLNWYIAEHYYDGNFFIRSVGLPKRLLLFIQVRVSDKTGHLETEWIEVFWITCENWLGHIWAKLCSFSRITSLHNLIHDTNTEETQFVTGSWW